MTADTLAPAAVRAPAICPCVEFHLNRVVFGSAECEHTRGEKPADSARPFDARKNAQDAQAWAAQQKGR